VTDNRQLFTMLYDEYGGKYTNRLTITMYGFDFAMYLSETSLASACCPGGKKSASSNNMKETSYGYALIRQSMKLAALYQANASGLLYTGTCLHSVVLVDIVLGDKD